MVAIIPSTCLPKKTKAEAWVGDHSDLPTGSWCERSPHPTPPERRQLKKGAAEANGMAWERSEPPELSHEAQRTIARTRTQRAEARCQRQGRLPPRRQRVAAVELQDGVLGTFEPPTGLPRRTPEKVLAEAFERSPYPENGHYYDEIFLV